MKTLYLDEDFTVQGDLTAFNDQGEQAVATGRSGGEAFFAATEGGDPVDPALVLPLNERAGRAGRYYADFDAALLAAHLAAYNGKIVYRCIRWPGDKADWAPIRVRDRR